ncbi:uncharacterized protein F5891DRAFT_1182216 [Suillus fuscotomentosus]|uniref:Uncharacterized protein n=1 Tax=Suillus fuscotomentosus TaxID=1912939 RepID=A0AAD4HSD0_9AGAM|nr:uncharacterized protein F5891DRAFT_1182216 [Suillus fuscotomentosus]KAG1906806.1 hypothetical protein F5891DRAFT_1182216 [Suillus fuscotomentosus]
MTTESEIQPTAGISLIDIMPQQAPRHVVQSDASESDFDDLDSPSLTAGISSTASHQSSETVSNSRRQQSHGDIEIVRCLQLENQALKNDNCTLGEKNKTLSSNQRQHSSTQVPDELKVFDVELLTFSRKYGIVAEMFPPEHCILKLPVLNPPPAIISGSRYASKSAEELGLVTELYSLLPDHLHQFVPTSHFQSLLEQQLQGGRLSEIGNLDLSYFNIGFTNWDTIPEIQKMLGTGPGNCSPLSKFPPILFTRQERDPTMSTVFGNWEPLSKAIRIVMFGKNSLDIAGWPCAKCNARKWGITSCTPSLLAWGWVALIFILSPNTSFTKDGVGAKSRLLYAAMFAAYKQLWVTLWEEPCILSIHQQIDRHVWQSTSSSNIATSDAEGKDLTSNLMCLALANAGRKDRESDSPTTDGHRVSPVPPSSPTLALAAPPAFPLTALAPAITPAVETTATVTPPAPVALAADETPPVPDVPDSVEMLPPAASSSSRQGCGRGKRGGLAAISLSAEQRETQTWRRN